MATKKSTGAPTKAEAPRATKSSPKEAKSPPPEQEAETSGTIRPDPVEGRGRPSARYWLLVAKPVSDANVTAKPFEVRVTRNISRVKSGDTVYLWSPTEPQSLRSWGKVMRGSILTESADEEPWYAIKVKVTAAPTPIPFEPDERLNPLIARQMQRASEGALIRLDYADVESLNESLRGYGHTAPQEPPLSGVPDPNMVAVRWDEFPLSRSSRRVLEVAEKIAGFRAPQEQSSTPSGTVPMTTSVLLFGLAEVAHERRAGSLTAKFVVERIVAEADPLFLKVKDAYLKRKRSQPGGAFMTRYLDGVLEEAEVMALRTTGKQQIHLRHLLAAILCYEGTEGDSGAVDRLNEMKLDVGALKKEFLESVTPGFGGDRKTAWAELLGTHTTESARLQPRRIGYAADDPSGEDLLNIREEVNGLASLIAAHTVKPPLSVGLFGDWGSGKTFFMRKLQERVEEIADDSRTSGKPQGDLAFYKRIIQIEFNAWHYVEGNLWASLVEHIFSNLRVSKDEDDNLLQERQDSVIKELEVQQKAYGEAEKAKERAEEVLQTTEKELGKIKSEHDTDAKKLRDLSTTDILATVALGAAEQEEVKDALNRAGFRDVQDSVTELYSTVNEAREVLSRGGAVLSALARNAEGSEDKFGMLVGMVVFIPLVGAAVSILTSIEALPAIAGSVAVTVGSITAWLKEQVSWVAGLVEKLEKAKKHIDDQLAKRERENRRQITELEHRLELQRVEYEAAIARRNEARRRVQEAEARLQRTAPGLLLAEFIEERTQSDDYRKHLGLLALVRRDFEQLSRLMERYNESLEEETGTAEPDTQNGDALKFNRIVLYIDDLDRCPEEKVIQVLQAIHLLLAFPLFVVVVGVDARWVSRSLAKQYRGLLGRRHRVTTSTEATNLPEPAAAFPDPDMAESASPHDYLEKIFQIPLWLKPIDDTGRGDLIDGLLKSSLMAADHGDGAGGPAGLGDGGAPTGSTGGNGADRTAAESQDADGRLHDAPEGADDEKVGDRVEATLDLEGLALDPEESSFLQALAPIFGETARAARMLRQVAKKYLLLKETIEDERDGAALRQDEHQALLFALSVAVSMGKRGRAFFRLLLGGQPGVDEKRLDLRGVLDGLRQDHEMSRLDELAYLEEWLEGYESGSWLAKSFADVEALIRKVPELTYGVELNPTALRIEKEEIKHMKRLRPLLGNSPRAVKRFVNVYRLIKAALPPEMQDPFLDETNRPPQYQIVMFLLGIVTGIPSTSNLFFKRLADNTGPTLPSYITTLEGEAGELGEKELHKVEKWLQTKEGESLRSATTTLLAEWAPRVARYSFRVGQV